MSEEEDPVVLRTVFGDLDAETLQSLYLRSRNLRALAFLYCMVGLLLLLTPTLPYEVNKVFSLLLGSGMLLTGIGYGNRGSWANAFGLIFALLCLLGFIGTLKAARPDFRLLILCGIDVWVYVKGKWLFGENRLTHYGLRDALRRSQGRNILD